MYGPAYRTPPALASQNHGEVWLDCTRRRRPRPHHFDADRVLRITTNGTMAIYWPCKRCRVTIRTTKREG